MQEQLLQQLRDIHAPDAIGIWPLAVGWWILIALAIVIFAGTAAWAILRYQRNAYRREAVFLAEQCFQLFEQDEDAPGYLGEINQLLRRLMIQIGSHQPSTQTQSTDWVLTMDEYGKNPLSKEAKTALSEQVYQPQPDADIPALHQELVAWVKTHRRKPLEKATGASQ